MFDIGLLAQTAHPGDRLAGRSTLGDGHPGRLLRGEYRAAAALWAASEPGVEIAAVVSRGGRPDLAWPRLPSVRAATLLIVGGDDSVVLDLNRAAAGTAALREPARGRPRGDPPVRGAGGVRTATTLTREWFSTRYLAPAHARA